MTSALIALSALTATTDWWSVATSRLRVEYIAKPLTMVFMLASAISAGLLDTTTGIWLAVGLVFGLLGDVALLGHKATNFIAGLTFFLIGHLAYVAALIPLLNPSVFAGVLAALCIGTAMFVDRKVFPTLWRDQGPGISIACGVYALVIAAMVFLAWLSDSWLCAIGATIFMCSDALLASGIARFGFAPGSAKERAIVMITYHSGQALLIIGTLTLGI